MTKCRSPSQLAVNSEAYGPLRDFALSETRRHCERLSAPKRRGVRQLNVVAGFRCKLGKPADVGLKKG